VSRYLDGRHLSCDWELDAQARAERREQLAKKSADKAEAEAARTAKAIRELVKAEDLLEEINDRIKQNGTPKDAADHTE
ncbi:hypothetical protein, partial [Escherichia coli]